MFIEFEEKQHIYSINGEIASISVTELLAKHGLALDYSGVDKSKLKESAEKGKEVHKDLENILMKDAKYEPTTEQGKQFKQWVKDNIYVGTAEQMLGYEKDGMLIAGTADIMAIGKDKRTMIIGDHKNTAKFHREYVSWQVSLLDYFARQLGREEINGKILNWKGAKQFYCFHYDPKTGEMSVYELEKVPDVEIETLLQCEYENKIYKRPQLIVDPELEQRFLTAEAYLMEVETTYRKAEEKAKGIRQEMLALFEKQGIKSWETPNGSLKVTYVEPTDRISVDSAKLKVKYPQAYTECQKLTQVKAQIRVKVREEE